MTTGPTADEIERVAKAQCTVFWGDDTYWDGFRVSARAAILAMDRCASPPAPAVAVPELLAKALAALDLYGDPTAYVDGDGEPLDADEKVHQGMFAQSAAAEIRAALASAPQPAVVAVPDGWRLVPIVPTLKQSQYGMMDRDLGTDRAYSSMVAAAPEPPAAEATALMQARYVLRNLHSQDSTCGYDKMAEACERAAAGQEPVAMGFARGIEAAAKWHDERVKEADEHLRRLPKRLYGREENPEWLAWADTSINHKDHAAAIRSLAQKGEGQ